MPNPLPTTLSEDESRSLLRPYGLPLVESRRVESATAAVHAAWELGFPVALKGTGARLAHKTEAGVVRLDLRSDREVEEAFAAITARAGATLEAVLVQRQIRSDREFAAGLRRDPSFGPCVMFGLGGIFTEALKDAVFRVAPLTAQDAEEMLVGLRSSKLLGAFRGQPAADRAALAQILIALGRLGLERPEVAEVDLNPILLDGARPVAVDALVVLAG
jgi:acetate---CoA ligase (ADP-forming) subunit beta